LWPFLHQAEGLFGIRRPIQSGDAVTATSMLVSGRRQIRGARVGAGHEVWRAINLDANCGWSYGKADVLYVADAFEVMKRVDELLSSR
jgi:hypothetical protein